MGILPLDITNKAVAEINNSLQIKGIPAEYCLRIGIKGGACSANYLIGFDQMQDHDELFEYQNTKIIIDKRHLMYVAGVKIDFELNGNGFTFGK